MVLLSVGGYLVILANEDSGGGTTARSGKGSEVGPGSTQPPPGETASPSSDPARQSAPTPNPTNPPNPSDPLQIDGCGGPPYPKTFEGSTGNPDFNNAATVVYFNGQMVNITRLGNEVARVAQLGCVSVPMNGASQPDLNAVAWSNVGIFTKEQVIVALSRMGVVAIPTPSCHPDCFR